MNRTTGNIELFSEILRGFFKLVAKSIFKIQDKMELITDQSNSELFSETWDVSLNGVTKAVVCIILSVGWCI